MPNARRRLPTGRVVCLTAIAPEYEAIKARLKRARTVKHPAGTIYRVGVFESARISWEVVLARLGAGNSFAAVQTMRAVDMFDPHLVMFVGVAGGLKGDVVLGDVIFADKVYGYEYGRADDVFRPRPRVYVPKRRFIDLALHTASSGEWRRRIRRSIETSAPNAHIGAVASGDKVVGSSTSSVAEILRRHFSDALAVEMEGYGLLEAAHFLDDWPAFVVRGVSDCLDDKNSVSDADWQPSASRNAAAFAFQLLSDLDPDDIRRPAVSGEPRPGAAAPTAIAASPSVLLLSMALARETKPSGRFPATTRFAPNADATEWTGSRVATLLGPVNHRYEIGEMLGKGAFGIVVRARDLKLADLQPQVALKISLVTERAARDAVLTEIARLRTLQHPNVIAYLDASAIDVEEMGVPGFYVATELGERSLESLLKTGEPPPPDLLLSVTGDVMRALSYIHSRGYVHGDIKPSNILEVAGTWKLADFGFAVEIGSEAPTGGTPAYMSPEALAGTVGAPSDMYAFGVTLLALFTNGQFAPRRRDRQATTVTDLVHAVTDPTPSVPDDLPGPWMQLIKRLISASPGERPDPSEVSAWCETIARQS